MDNGGRGVASTVHMVSSILYTFDITAVMSLQLLGGALRRRLVAVTACVYI